MDIPTPMAEQARQRLEQLATSLEEIRSMLASRKPDPRYDRLEWEGHIGRRAVTLATAAVLREELAALATDMPAGGLQQRASALVPWINRLVDLAQLPAAAETDYVWQASCPASPSREEGGECNLVGRLN